MTNEPDDWGPGEREALRDLARDEAPPPEALDRTVAALRRAGLIGGRRAKARTWIAAAAAVAAAFAGGLLTGRPPVPAAADARPQFVVLLYGAAATDAGEQARQVGEIKTWARGLARAGHALSGAKLAASEYTLGDGGASSTAELGGYIVLAAEGPEDALAMARTCPHLRHGGRIVVRPVDPT